MRGSAIVSAHGGMGTGRDSGKLGGKSVRPPDPVVYPEDSPMRGPRLESVPGEWAAIGVAAR